MTSEILTTAELEGYQRGCDAGAMCNPIALRILLESHAALVEQMAEAEREFDDWRRGNERTLAALSESNANLRTQLSAAEVTIDGFRTRSDAYSDALATEYSLRIDSEGREAVLRAALEKAQWAEYYDVDGDHEEAHGEEDGVYFACPVCTGYQNTGHTPNCIIALALANPAVKGADVLATETLLTEISTALTKAPEMTWAHNQMKLILKETTDDWTRRIENT